MIVLSLHVQILLLRWERFQGSLSLRNSGFWRKFSSSHAPTIYQKGFLAWTEKRIIGYNSPDLNSHLFFFFLFLSLSISLWIAWHTIWLGRGKKRKTNKNWGEQNLSPIGHFCVIYKATSSGQSLIFGDFQLPHSWGEQRLLHMSAHWLPTEKQTVR